MAGDESPAEVADGDTATAMPNWFADFLIDRAPRKPSAHTMKAYRQDFAAVAALLNGGDPADVVLTNENQDAGRVRRLRRNTRTGLDPALLVNLECVVRVSLYR
jgi:hypothetical protein